MRVKRSGWIRSDKNRFMAPAPRLVVEGRDDVLKLVDGKVWNKRKVPEKRKGGKSGDV